MGHNPKSADDDETGGAATSNVAGDLVLNSVLAAQEDELDQVLILTHLALGISLAPLARDLKMDRQEVDIRVARILTELSRDMGLCARLNGIRRAGQIEHYYPIIARLGLLNWFCACPGCPNPIVQPQTGRPRKTCSSRCRNRLNRSRGVSSEGRDDTGSPPHADRQDAGSQVAEDTLIMRNLMLSLMRPLNFPHLATRWSRPNIHCRDRALLLLGLTCPVPITIGDLRDLDIDDVGKTSKGVEVKFYKRRDNQQPRYIVIPASDDPALCTAQALLSWRRLLIRNSRTTGPLFIRLERSGKMPDSIDRLGTDTVTKLIFGAFHEIGVVNERLGLRTSMPLSYCLETIIRDISFRERMLKFKPRPDHPLGPDPCEQRPAE